MSITRQTNDLRVYKANPNMDLGRSDIEKLKIFIPPGYGFTLLPYSPIYSYKLQYSSIVQDIICC